MTEAIWIQGMGIVSSMGMDLEESLAAFRSGSSGIGEISILDTIFRADFKAGEIGLSREELMERLQIPAYRSRDYSRTSMLGMLAARQAFTDAGLDEELDVDEGIDGPDAEGGIPTALVSATTIGGMDRTEVDYAAKDFGSGFITTHPCGDSTDRIAASLGLNGYRTSLSTACSSSANAVIHGARLIRHRIVERAIVGGVDALSKFTLNGFNSLMILDRDECKPFDRDRKGLNLGEGAAYLVLESDRLAHRRGGKRYARLSGYANANDAHHQTASSPEGEGAYLAMSAALAMAGLEPGDIDYINAHGTGTENNDASEGTALRRLFGGALPPFSSTKAYTGHTLGAAGAVEAVFSILAIREGMLIPGLGFSHPMEELGIQPVQALVEGEAVRHVLSNSFGFGGNNTTLIFSK